jgi:hypothetical protein
MRRRVVSFLLLLPYLVQFSRMRGPPPRINERFASKFYCRLGAFFTLSMASLPASFVLPIAL